MSKTKVEQSSRATAVGSLKPLIPDSCIANIKVPKWRVLAARAKAPMVRRKSYRRSNRVGRTMGNAPVLFS